MGVVGSGLGLLLNALSPTPIALGVPVHAAAESGAASCSTPHGEGNNAPIPLLSLEEALVRCEACSAQFVDARPASAYAQGHVPEAVHLPPSGDGETPALLERLRAAPLVVVYDSGAGCDLAETVARRLRDEGLAEVRILEGAWPAWEARNGPAASGACGACGGHP